MSNQRPVDEGEILPALDELFGAIDKYRTSQGFLELLKFLPTLPAVGPYNALLLHIQRPGVTHVATVGGWRQLEREVKRAAHPLVTLRAFGPIEFVYDIEDTTGPDLHPDLSDPFRTDGKLPAQVLERTAAHAESDQIAILTVEFGSSLAGRVSGQLADREVVRLSGGAPAALVVELNKRFLREARYTTLVHELAHVYCGHLGVPPGAWWPDRRELDLVRQELEAEAVTWIVCARQGIDPGSYRYLEGYLHAKTHVPDISLNQLVVAANHIEMLGTTRFRPKRLEGVRTAGHGLSGVLSVNTGRPATEEDIKLAEEIIAKVGSEQREGS